MVMPDYVPFFPFPGIRDQQRTAIEFAIDAFLVQGKKHVILDLGTGVGKSAIAVTLARYLAVHGGKTTDDAGEETTGAYLLTTQKLLQQQYVNDFGPSSVLELVRSLKSASNYTCKFYADQSCAASRRLLKQLGQQLVGSEFHRCCRGGCPYVVDKQEFIDSPLGITNFAYFLAETMYAKQLKPRSLLVVDECHRIEDELSKFVEVTFSERFARNALGCKVPKLDGDEAVIGWVKGAYRTAVCKHLRSAEKKLLELYDDNDNSDALVKLADASKKFEALDKHLCKVNRFIEGYEPNNWIMNPTKTPQGEQRGGRKFEFKPVDVSRYGDSHLYRYGSRVLTMSATVIDKDAFCKSVGIDPTQAAYLHMPSPFPVENRPVHFLDVGSMSMKNIDKTLPNVAETVRELLRQHENDKGLVHCVSFRVAKHIVDVVKSPRLLLHDSTNREETLRKHLSSCEPTVLVSPSMTEGVDLADNASRFQVLCKVPFPYLGDRVIQRRKERDNRWYSMVTARAIMQGLGRSIRNQDDHATSYILDSDWRRFYAMNSDMFPAEFAQALS